MIGGIGTTELVVILVVALVVLGPKKLPQVARSLGKAFGEFKRVSTDVKRTIDTEVDRLEKEDRDEKARGELRSEDAGAGKKADVEEGESPEPEASAGPDGDDEPVEERGEKSEPPEQDADAASAEMNEEDDKKQRDKSDA
jgi:sec-independent protein translocase protein TatB